MNYYLPFRYLLIIKITIALSVVNISRAEVSPLPDPDGKPADMSKKVKVFIIMGQSNTLEMGKVKGGEGSLENAARIAIG